MTYDSLDIEGSSVDNSLQPWEVNTKIEKVVRDIIALAEKYKYTKTIVPKIKKKYDFYLK